MSIKVDEFPSKFGFQINSYSTDRITQDMRVFKWTCCKWTVLFAAARFFIWPATTNHFNNPQSGKRNVSEWTSHIVFCFRREWSVFRAKIRQSSSFNRRRSRHLFFSYNLSLLHLRCDFDIVSSFVVIPCVRWLITQYFRFHSVVHFNMYSSAEQIAQLCAFHVQGYWNLYSGSDLEIYIDWKTCNRRQ